MNVVQQPSPFIRCAFNGSLRTEQDAARALAQAARGVSAAALQLLKRRETSIAQLPDLWQNLSHLVKQPAVCKQLEE
jgi:hypothetical protein